jgi:hypothetical protein
VYLRCRYPADRVPSRTGLKTRQGAGRASMRCHVPYSSRPYLATEVGSGTATCPKAPDLSSRLRWYPALLCVQRLWTSPPCRDGLRRCHVSNGSAPHLSTEVGSNTATCPMAPDPTSQSGRVPMLPRIPRFPVVLKYMRA